ncbi:MAG: type II toxin-antitoxin system VapC family toxin [Candidatus Micrarchaeota archaeon]|nr:type II toxin-antitoxin system VapC family toxin [Candidatus Micrarchaeota archaeon]
MKYIFDSSAIFRAVEKGLHSKLDGSYTLTLARYELGNIVLCEGKIHKRINTAEQYEISKSFEKMLKFMHLVEIEGVIGNIIKTANETNSSFYDASYIYYSKITGMPLVTEDTKLANRIGTYVKVVNIAEI